jgi:hypothetical protein
MLLAIHFDPPPLKFARGHGRPRAGRRDPAERGTGTGCPIGPRGFQNQLAQAISVTS